MNNHPKPMPKPPLVHQSRIIMQSPFSADRRLAFGAHIMQQPIPSSRSAFFFWSSLSAP